MKTALTASLLVVFFFALGVKDALARKWSDTTGRFNLEAEFVELNDGKVALEKTDGKIIRVPIERLSDEDRRFVASLQKKPQDSGKEPPDAKPSDANAKKKSPAKELDAKVIAEWRKAGALIGWLSQSDFGEWQYLKNKPQGVDSLPVFLWPKFEAGMFAKLPAPAAPFAMGLGNTVIDNAGLKELAQLQNLQAVDLSHTKVTDAGLKELAALMNLHSVDLGASAVTDAGLRELAAVKSLQKLYFGSTAVTDAGLKELAGLRSLQTLYVYNTKVTNAGLKHLASHQNLQTLLLYKTKVNDAGLKELAGLQNLQTLGLISTAVTDDGLKELAGFQNLQTVHLVETKVTDDGVTDLKKVRPDLKIVR